MSLQTSRPGFPHSRLRLLQLEDRITPSPAGDLDPSFGTGGRFLGGFYTQVIAHVGVFTTTAAGYALATQPDGKIILGGHGSNYGFTEGPPPIGGPFGYGGPLLLRLNPDGSRDTTFSGPAAGYLGTSTIVQAIAVQPDGKIVLAGNTGAVARLLPDGSSDPTFGTDGKVFLPLSGGLRGVALQPDGRIILSGGTQTAAGGSDFAAVRLLPDGSLDSTFGAGGVDAIDLGAATDESAARLVIQPDGRIVLVGTTNGETTGADFAAVRLLADGALDPMFGTGGKVVVAYPAAAGASQTDTGTGIALGPGGTVVLAGAVGGRDLGAVRLAADGALDPGFGSSGRVVVPLGYAGLTGADVLVQRDGKIVLASTGRTFNASPTTVVRLFADGSADPTFGTAGRVDLAGSIEAIATQPDGRLLLVGGTLDMMAYRLLGDPPTVSDIPDLTILADGVAGPLSFTVAAGAGDPALLTVVAASDNPSLIPDDRILLGGAGAGRTLTLHPSAGQSGTATITLTVTDASGQTASDHLVLTVLPTPPPPSVSPPPPPAPVTPPVTPPSPPVTPPAPRPQPVMAGGQVDGTAALYTPVDGQYLSAGTLPVFPGVAVTVRVATADVNGDGVPDHIAAAGPGGGPRVVVIDGKTAGTLADFFAFDPAFRGGVLVAAGDIDGDGKADLVVTPDDTGGPVVAVFSGAKLAVGLSGPAAEIGRFTGIEDPAFRGGARSAVGDVNGDGYADLIVAAGDGGGPRVAVFDGKSVAAGSPTRLVPDFFAFESTFRNGALVAAGDVNGDGFADLALGGAPGAAPRVRLFDGKALSAAAPFPDLDQVPPSARLADFFAEDAALRGGVRLAMRDADGDGRADLIAGSGDGEPSRVRVYLSANLLANAIPTPDQELDPFSGAVLANGVFVG
jgi:uncharacterized delta-60 repeat protein